MSILLDNAIRHSGDSGRVLLRLTKETLTMLKIKKNTQVYDVIVAGGGPAGCAAAAAAARGGAKTLLLESSGALGGMATMGMVTSWAPFSDGEKMIYRGFAERVFEKSKAAMPNVKKDELDWVPLSPEALKVIYDDEVKAAGAEVGFFSTVVGVETADHKITELYVARKDGVTSFTAKVYIDCTGDAGVAAFAGAPFEKGGENGELQPATLCFVIAGIDEKALGSTKLYGYHPSSPIHKMMRSDKYPLIKETHLCIDHLADGIISFNAGHIWDSDGTDPDCVSDAIVRGRKIAAEFHRGFKELLPEAFGRSFLIATAPLLGIRETRRIQGHYTFTVRDYLERKSFDDEIARNCYYIDLHQENTSGVVSDEEAGFLSEYKKGESHGIPYRCLLPKGVDNLLVAGRAISSDRLSNASLRVMPNCLTTGEAAGTAAALVCKQDTSVSQVDTDKLRAILKQNGAYIF